MKLQQGDIIQVHGFVMLEKMEGKLKVSHFTEHYGKLAYVFTKPKGKKIVIAHYCNNVDGWIDNPYCKIKS